MDRYDYLVVGGGMAADSALRGIREVDPRSSVGILSADDVPPHDRPPLSKSLWSGARLEDVFHHLDYASQGATLHLTTVVAELRPTEHEVVTTDGTRVRYGKLLLATGCAPRPLPPGVAGGHHVRLYRGLSDYLRLRQAVSGEGAPRLLLVGGGFITAELAAALSANTHARVTMVMPEQALWASRLPADLAAFMTEYYGKRQVEVVTGETIRSVAERDGGSVLVEGASGRTWPADLVLAGIGAEPRTALAKAAGLAVEDGIAVDATCRTAVEDVFACGDVASFPSTAGGRLRVEHEDHAHHHGRLAGRNMTGLREPYEHIPMFYSDLFDLGFEAVGRLDARCETYADWAEPYRQGVVYYLDPTRRVVGVLLWNVWERLDAAREILREGRSWGDPRELAGRIRA
jgi:3-phenylpropionate/trans-cinnamate dioxygenase ferredoxin reductase component